MRDAVAFHSWQIDDTQVVDDPDAQTVCISVGRVSTEDLVAQVNVIGVWHRRTPDLKTTACGIPYHSQFAPTRREELCNPLCAECFTHHELAVANVRDIEEGEK